MRRLSLLFLIVFIVHPYSQADTSLLGIEETVGICGRTKQVVQAILSSLNTDDCSQVSREQLETFSKLRVPNLTSLKAGDFSGLTYLDALWLYNSNLETLPPEIFSELPYLTSLDLHNINLKTLPKGAFSGLLSLKGIDLHNNNLKTLPKEAFSGLHFLETLYLSDNKLESLPEKAFSGLHSLETLYLDNNNLKTLPSGIFSKLKSLKRLSIDPIKQIPESLTSRISSIEAFQGDAGRVGIGLILE